MADRRMFAKTIIDGVQTSWDFPGLPGAAIHQTVYINAQPTLIEAQAATSTIYYKIEEVPE